MYGQEIRWNVPGRRRRILAFSDLHFCEVVAKRRVSMILRHWRAVGRKEKIDYIFFLGDLVNSLGVLDDARLKAELMAFLCSLAEIAPVMLVTGNHDLSYYTDGMDRGGMCPEVWYRWVPELEQNPRIRVLDAALGKERDVFDDGIIRVLGLNLPNECYVESGKHGQSSTKVFRKYIKDVLPRLTAVEEREYYLLVHNPQFLSEVELDSSIVMLAGHMHNGLIPPVADELLRFTNRGVVAPGYYDQKGHKIAYIPFGSGARYRPRDDRLWLTLNSCVHLPPEFWLWHFDWIFPAISYAIISGDGPEMKWSNRYFLC